MFKALVRIFLSLSIIFYTTNNLSFSVVQKSESPLIRYLHKASPKTPLEIFNGAYAAGALKIGSSSEEKEQALNAIQQAYDQYMLKHPKAIVGLDLYKFVEGSLNRKNLLTSSFIPDYPTPEVVTRSPTVVFTPPVIQQVIQPAPKKIDTEPFLTALLNTPLDAYKIFNALSGKNLLSDKARKDRKSVTKLISDVIKVSQEKRLKELNASTSKELQEKLTEQGFLK